MYFREQAFRALNYWFQQPLGQAVAQTISEEISDLNLRAPGPSVLQIGAESQGTWLHLNPMCRRYVLTPYLNHAPGAVVGLCEDLPFLTHSIHLAFLPCVLELLSERGSLFRELDRVLTEDGYLIICGINPLSLFGLAQCFKAQSLLPFLKTKLYNSAEVRHMLLEQGFQIEVFKRFCCVPPLVSERVWQYMTFLGRLGLCPRNMYLLVVRKKTHTLLPLRPFRRFREVAYGGEFA